MDACNTFETRTTAALARVEYGALLAVGTALTVAHLDEVSWPTFVGLFLVIDAVGYLPGHLAYRRSPSGAVPRVYYVLYNLMHSLTTWAVLLSAWVLLLGWEWALMAVPLHLLGDRALFGNSLKPFGVCFEPVPHPAFTAFQADYARAATPRLEEARRGH